MAGAVPPPAASCGGPDGGGPLAGLRIIDFTAFWAGPFATQYLAAMGADVIKVESIQRPDGMRFQSVRPPTDDGWWEWGALYQTVNLGKRGITLDLGRPAGVELVKRLIADADAVVENFSPRVMDNLGLDYTELAARNPRLIMVRMPAFGLDGPWRDRVGFAQTMEQLTGMAWLTGFADGPPVMPRGPCDPLAGLHAVVALLVALEHRHRTGRGQLVESTMVEAALNAAAEPILEYGAHGARLARDGNRGPVGAPQNLYACRGDDRWLALAVTSDAQWQALRALMGDPGWARDAALATAAGRRAAPRPHRSGDRRVVRDARCGRRWRRSWWRVASRPRRWCRRPGCHAIRSSSRAASSRPWPIRSSARTSIRRFRSASRASPGAGTRGRRRRSASTPRRSCAISWGSTRKRSRACAPPA